MKPGAKDPAGGSLGRLVLGGAAWTWSMAAVTAVVQLGYTATMARAVSPEDFGLVAAATLGLRLVGVIARMGLESAVAQRSSLSDEEVTAVLRLAAGTGFAGTVVGVAASPLLARAVGDPRSTEVMVWLACGTLPAVMGGVLDGVLRRRFEFRRAALVQVISLVLGYLGVGVPLALAGLGWQSLVAATLSATYLLFLFQWQSVRPSRTGRCATASNRSLVRFGGVVSLTQITEVLTSTTDTLLVGRWLGPTALGQYSRATLLVELPVVQVSSATSRVLTPALSRLQDDEQRFASSMLRAAGIQALVVLTPVLLACSASTTLVEVVLGGGWGISADVLPVVACASGLSLLTHIVATAAEAKGQVVSKLGVQLATLSVLVGSLAVTGTSGPTPVRLAVAWLVSESVRHLLYWRFLLPRLGVSRRQLATKFSGALMFAVVTAFPVFVAHQVLGMRGLAVVGLSAGIGAVAAVGLAAKGWLHEVGEDARYLKSAISGR